MPRRKLEYSCEVLYERFVLALTPRSQATPDQGVDVVGIDRHDDGPQAVGDERSTLAEDGVAQARSRVLIPVTAR